MRCRSATGAALFRRQREKPGSQRVVSGRSGAQVGAAASGATRPLWCPDTSRTTRAIPMLPHSFR